ncbi:TonB-dependent siderophore receptor [Isoalcanivorax beigongshangi]|uniref:TonB-dependent siderophore receptor n=1 Tax=Isoalcanivorax beigongshangi TaxID=3238810 RepID=A0ABV4AH67_9GAMM
MLRHTYGGRSAADSALSPAPARGTRTALAWALCASLGTVGGVAAVTPALAQQADSAVARSSYRIAAGPLASVLHQFASHAGVRVQLDPALARGRQSGGLSGDYSIQEGLAALLSEHGLQAVRQGGGYAVVATAASDASTLTLAPVSVQGQTGQTLRYAGEQVAPGSRVGLLGDRDFMETPFSTVAYTEKYIADQQATDIQQIIAKTDPSVFISGIAGESLESYSIRGLPSAVNDVSVNGLAGVGAYHRNAPEMFERIDVLKGPSALLNGMPPKGSAGGAVNLVTKRAGDDPLTRFTGSWQSDAQVGGHVDVGRRFGDNNEFGVRFNGVYRDGETAVKKQDKEVKMASLGLDWRGERARLSADLYHMEDYTEGLTRGLTLAPGVAVPKPPKPGTSWNPPWSFFDNTDKGGLLRGEFDITDQLMVYATAGLSKSEIDTIMGVGNVLNSSGDFSINYSGVSDRMERKSAEVGLQGSVQTGVVGHRFAVNATYYKEDYTLRGFRNLLPNNWLSNIYRPEWGPEVARPSNIPALTDTGTTLTSVGAADTLSFFDEQLQLTVGVRHQQVESEVKSYLPGPAQPRYDKNATTPAAALLYRATEQVSLYANYSEGLSQGPIAPIGTTNAGEVFKPFKSKQHEIGVKFDLGEFAHTLSLYEIKRPNGYTDNNQYVFGGEQRNRGVEWGFFGAPVVSLRVMGGVAYSDAEVTRAVTPNLEGQQATGLPEWQAKLGVEWDVPVVERLTLTANTSYASKQYVDAANTQSIPDRTLLDLGARYRTGLANYPVTFRAAVTNVTNKAYWATPHFTNLALGAPRTFQLSASVDF